MSRKKRSQVRVAKQVTPNVTQNETQKNTAYQIPMAAIREAAIQAGMFESATPPKRLEVFFADATDAYADQITQESVRQEMRANSRKVYLTEGCTSHGTFTMGVHCVGQNGPDLAMIPPKQKGRLSSDSFAPELTPEEREHLEWEWYYFTEAIDLKEHLRMATEALQFDGEMFFRMVYDPQVEDVNLNLEQIEAKRVRFPMDGAWKEDMVSGIQFDGLHPKAYYILPKTINPAMDWNWNAIQVPADDVLHFFIPRLPDQHRGIPWMQAVLNDVAETQLYESYHLGAANAAARNSGGVVEAPQNFVQGNEPTIKDLKPIYTAPNPGEIKQLIPGLIYKQGSANWPTSSYTGFIDAKREKHAAGMQMTKAMLTNNFEKHNYSSFRGEMVVYWEIIKFIRTRLEKQILNPLFIRWLECLSAVDTIVATVIERFRYRYRRIPRTWVWSPIPAYDLADLIAALADAVEHGFMSRKMATSILGHDFEQVEQDRKEDTFVSENASSGVVVAPS